MEELAERFIEERDRQGARGPGRRVPEGLRSLARRYASWAMEEGGESVSAVARRLELTPLTLERWLASGQEEAAPPVMREVVVRDAVEALAGGQGEMGLTLVTPDGFRVEGLAAAELVEILRALRT